MEAFQVVQPGPLTTVQDLGRHGWQQYGVPPSGAIDDYAFRIANILVGNDESAASLEITLVGCQLRVLEDTVIALTGADLAPTVNGAPIPMWETFPVSRGDNIAFLRLKTGCRAYLAVSGGINVPRVMASAATCIRAGIGGFEGRALRSGDTLRTVEGTSPPVRARVPREYWPDYGSQIELRVILGPQDDYFTDEGIRTFLRSEYTISAQADRMGCRLEGPQIQHIAGADIISDGIPLGAVQVPGNGLPIILLVDRQTTGGYTKIATVVSTEIPKLAQAKPGDKVGFRQVGDERAWIALTEEYEERILAVKRLLRGQ
jgi:antagonist of KipI